jgi:methylase of polypeptide subunit release factors
MTAPAGTRLFESAPATALDEDALVDLLSVLEDADYDFVPPTPATHECVLARGPKGGSVNLRDIFGWSRPFDRADVPGEIFEAMQRAGVLVAMDGRLRSRLRVARLRERLFLHSAFPPRAADAVFFGPDSYRFVNLLEGELAGRPEGSCLLDVGAGSGVGGIVASSLVRAARTILTDINPQVFPLARANARFAGVDVECVECSGVGGGPVEVDLIIANPPFIAGNGGRIYRDGGDLIGARLSLNWAIAGASRLSPGGRMVLYTGSAIVEGRDRLKEALARCLPSDRYSLRYRELDPDIFGEQLCEPEYRDVERIAAIGATIDRRS